MSDYRRPVYTVDSKQSYSNKKEAGQKRTISGVKKKVPFKFLKDNAKKIIIGLVAAGIIIGGAAKGIDEISDKIKENRQIEGVVEMFSDSLEETYDESEFLQATFREGDYTKYSEGIIEDTLRDEKSLVTYLEQAGKTPEFDENAWLYILSGEGNREVLEDEAILDALKQYQPHSETVSFSEGKPDKTVSYYAQFAGACVGQENQEDFIALFDAAVGGTSLSNSPEAINYRIGQIAEINNWVEYGSKSVLEETIAINNNFDNNFKESRQALKPYFTKLYNPRVEAAQGIENSQAFNSARDPKALHKLTRRVADYDVVDDPYIAIRDQGKMMNARVATPEDYDKFRETRNQLYRFCIDAIDDPKIVEELKQIEASLQEKLRAYELYEQKDSKFLEEVYSLISTRAQLLEQLNNSNTQIRNSGFEDFSR